jgi:hypothetical protein
MHRGTLVRIGGLGGVFPKLPIGSGGVIASTPESVTLQHSGA